MMRYCSPHAVAWICMVACGMASAQGVRSPSVAAQVAHAHGDVRLTDDEGHPRSQVLASGAQVPAGRRIEAGKGASVSLRLADGSMVKVLADSAMRLEPAPAARHQPISVNIVRGRVEVVVPHAQGAPRGFEVRSPVAVAGVRGTMFGVSLGGDGALAVDVMRGQVQVSTLTGRQASAVLEGGHGVRVEADGALLANRQMLLRPHLSAIPIRIEGTSLLTLDAQPVDGATAYRFQIANDASFDDVIRNAVFTQPRAVFAGLEEGNYFLSVRAIDEAGVTGAETWRRLNVHSRPEAPLLFVPRATAGSSGSGVESVVLHCTEPAGEQAFRIQVARDSRFESLVLDQDGLPRCAYRLDGLPPGLYHWRAQSAGASADVVGVFSPAAAFSVGVGTPRGTAQAAAERTGYRVQIASDIGFTEIQRDVKTDDLQVIANLQAGEYFLRWQQISRDGVIGMFSRPQRLVIQPSP